MSRAVTSVALVLFMLQRRALHPNLTHQPARSEALMWITLQRDERSNNGASVHTTSNTSAIPSNTDKSVATNAAATASGSSTLMSANYKSAKGKSINKSKSVLTASPVLQLVRLVSPPCSFI